MSEVSHSEIDINTFDKGKSSEPLTRSIQKINRLEKDELKKLGQVVDSEGNAKLAPRESMWRVVKRVITGNSASRDQRPETRDDYVQNPARRAFLKNMGKTAAAGFAGSLLEHPLANAIVSPFLPNEGSGGTPETEAASELEILGRFHPEYPALTQEEVNRTTEQLISLLNNRSEVLQTLPDNGKVVIVNAYRRVGLIFQRAGDTIAPVAQFPTGLCTLGDQLTDFAISKVDETHILDNDPTYANGLIGLTLIDGQPNPDEIHGNALPRSQDRFVQITNSSLGCVIADQEVIARLTNSDETALHPNDIVIVSPDEITDLTAYFTGTSIKSAGEYYSPLGSPPPPHPNSYESSAYAEYINTNEPVIENTDRIEPDNDLFSGLGYDEVVTVNIRSGEVNLFVSNDSGIFDRDPNFQSFGLVGERLPRRKTLEDDIRSYYPNGEYRYDRRGILYMKSPNGEIPRHTLTPPAIFDLQGFTSRNGFGGTPEDVSTRYMLLNTVLRGPDGTTAISQEESPYTIHEIPPVPDERSRNFANRRRVVEEALQNNEPVEDPFWSHGCVNVDASFYSRLEQQLEGRLQNGRKIAIVFAYPEVDQVDLLNAQDLNFSFSYRDPLTGDNMRFLPEGETGIYHTGEPGSETFESESIQQLYLDLRNLNLDREISDNSDLSPEGHQFVRFCSQFSGIPENQAINLYTFAEMPPQGSAYNQLQQAIRNVLYAQLDPSARTALINRLFERVRHYQQLQMI